MSDVKIIGRCMWCGHEQGFAGSNYRDIEDGMWDAECPDCAAVSGYVFVSEATDA